MMKLSTSLLITAIGITVLTVILNLLLLGEFTHLTYKASDKDIRIMMFICELCVIVFGTIFLNLKEIVTDGQDH